MAGVLDIETLSAGSFYPGLSSETSSPRSMEEQAPKAVSNGNPLIERAFHAATLGRPVAWWFAFAVLLLGLMFLAKKTGAEGFSNIKMSFYNILVIGLAAILGISLLKAISMLFPVKGLTGFILSS